MGIADFLDNIELVAAPQCRGGSGPFADSVHGENQSVLEGRRKKRAGRMALVMFGKQQPAVWIGVRPNVAPLPAEQILLKKFFANPKRQRHLEGAHAARR